MKISSGKNKKLSIRHHLIGLVMIAVIPVVFFAAVLIAYLAQQSSQVLENNLIGTTKTLTTAVDEQIVSVVSSLRILSEVEDFHPQSIQYLHKRLRRFVKNQKDWAYISIVDTRGTQIFKTSEPFGRKLPRINEQDFFKKMIETKKTVISGFRADENVVTVSVPVKKDGIIMYALVGSLKIDSFAQLLSTHKLPRNWTAVILDQDAFILGHSNDQKQFGGKKASAKLSEKIFFKDSQIFNSLDREGHEAYGVASHSRITGWTVVLRISNNGELFSYWKFISLIILGGALFLGVSIFLAVKMGRRISQPILALAQSAKALGQGSLLKENGKELGSSLQEISDVSEALQTAAIKRSENEEKIKTLYDKAQEAVKLRDTFLSVASHELKTPITTLSLQFQMLDRVIKKKESISREELERPVRRVLEQVRRLTLLIDDLLDVSRISSGKMEYHPENFDLVPFVNDVIQQLESESHKANCPIGLQGSPTLTGNWDRHRLEQVMVNLMTNAIKYGNSKPVMITISGSETHAYIEVKDQGIGISADNLCRIFERYERVVDDKSISGLGLGLWIVKNIIQGMGGHISVTSEIGLGSAFKVELPFNSIDDESVKKLLHLNTHHGAQNP